MFLAILKILKENSLNLANNRQWILSLLSASRRIAKLAIIHDKV